MVFKPHNTTPVVNPTVPNVTQNSKFLALNSGINDYPGTGNDLNGCINDCADWNGPLARQYGFRTTILRDSEATATNTKSWLTDAVAKAGDGWHIVWTYSGHGSNVPDKDGDEPDSRDECICLYDRFLIDDEIRDILKNLHPLAKFTFISDSCHSGTVTRAFMSTLDINAAYAKPRFLPPQDDPNEAVAPQAMGRFMEPQESSMNEVLVSGCLPTEYSYDANINGRYNGAMTYYAVNILKQTPSITYRDFYTQLRKSLPNSKYPQTPQLEGKEENKNKLMFT